MPKDQSEPRTPRTSPPLIVPIGPKIGNGAKELMALEERRNTIMEACAREQAKVMGLPAGAHEFWQRAMPEAILSLLENVQGGLEAAVAFLMKQAVNDAIYQIEPNKFVTTYGLPVKVVYPIVKRMAYVIVGDQGSQGWPLGLAVEDEAGYTRLDGPKAKFAQGANRDEAQGDVDRMNSIAFGLDREQSWKVVASSVAAQNQANAKPTHPVLEARRVATILAALRYWQQDRRHMDLSLMDEGDHFHDHTPLSEEEIDALCEEINLSE